MLKYVPKIGFFYNVAENNINKNRMIAHAFCDIWSLVMFLKFSNNWAYCSLRNEMGRNEMEICSLRNGNLYFAKWKSVVCEMRICSLRNENL